MPEETFENSLPMQPVAEPKAEPKAANRPKIILAAVLGLGLLAGAAYAGYWYGTESAKLKTQNEKPQLKTQIQVTLTPTPAPLFEPTPPPSPAQSDVAEWKTYKNVDFRLRY